MVALEDAWLNRHWLSVLSAVERELPEFLIGFADQERFQAERLESGYRVIERWPMLDAGVAEQLPRIARIAGQGAVIGRELCYQCLVTDEETRLIEDVCALANVMISGFDQVLDERPQGASELTTAIARERIVMALDLRRANAAPIFALPAFTDPAAKYVAAVAEIFFAQCRKLGIRKADERKWARFAAAILEAYDAELVAASPLERPVEVLREAFRLKSAHSCSILGGVVELSSAPRLAFANTSLIDAMMPLGEIAGMIDDLCDVAIDLASGQRSSLLLMARTEWRPGTTSLGIAEAYEALTRDLVVDQAIRVMALSMRALRQSCQEMFEDPDRFMTSVRIWLGTWLDAGPMVP